MYGKETLKDLGLVKEVLLERKTIIVNQMVASGANCNPQKSTDLARFESKIRSNFHSTWDSVFMRFVCYLQIIVCSENEELLSCEHQFMYLVLQI